MGIFQRGTKRETASGHKFNVAMPKLPEAMVKAESPSPLIPLISPAVEEVPIWNILPSYHLYESTFAKVLDPSIQDFSEEPPTYEISPPPSASPETESDYFTSHANTRRTETSLRTPEPRWENTILANAHRMKNVDEFNKSVSDKLKVDIVLTKTPGAKGRIPEIYDPSDLEFSQGDSIHGYVIVQNTCDEPLSFDMFSVVFEGRVSVNSNEGHSEGKPLLFHKFLNMFDYNASWTPVFFEGSSMEFRDYIDPFDGTVLQFPFKRQLEPGVQYKKFFNFSIPGKLLDCCCEPHEIPQHCVLSPSIGLDKHVFLQKLRKLRENPRPLPPPRNPSSSSIASNGNMKKKAPNLITRDYGFPDTSISYSVETRVIGKRSVYDKQTSSSKDEFIIIKEASMALRVIPRDIDSINLDSNGYMAEKHYKSFVKTIEMCLETGRRLQEGKESNAPMRKSSIIKQTYDASPQVPNHNSHDVYKVHYPYKKKLLTQADRIVGLLNAIVPKKEHVIRYETPYNFVPLTDFSTENSSKIQTKINLEYFTTEKGTKSIKPPEIKAICAKVVICTIRSKKYPIPLEFTQDMKFRNIVGSTDDIEKYVIVPFKKNLEEMQKLIDSYGSHALGINGQSLMDVKSLANLDFKTATLKVDNIHISSPGGLGHWKGTDDPTKVENSFEFNVDIQSLFVKDSKRSTEDKLNGALTLVPSFQSCIICRYYYLLVEIKLGNGEIIPVKIPFKIS